MTLSTMTISNAKTLYRIEYGQEWPLNDIVVGRLITDFAAYDTAILLAEMDKEVRVSNVRLDW